MNDRRFQGAIERLRSPERVARLDVDRVMEATLHHLAPKKILDVGTGSGLFAEAFAQRGWEVTGIDASEEMIAAARALVPKATFLKASMEHLPFPDATFEVVFFGLAACRT